MADSGEERKAGLGHLRFSTDWFLASGTIGCGPAPVTWWILYPYHHMIETVTLVPIRFNL